MCNTISRINNASDHSHCAFILLSALITFIPGFHRNNLRSAIPVSGCSCPNRSIRLQEVCALYRILPRPFDYISLSLSFLCSPPPRIFPLSLPLPPFILQVLGAFWRPFSSIKTPGNKRKSSGESCCFTIFLVMVHCSNEV